MDRGMDLRFWPEQLYLERDMRFWLEKAETSALA
jgi:hypothetical protein